MILDAEIKIRLMGQPKNGEFHGKNLKSLLLKIGNTLFIRWQTWQYEQVDNSTKKLFRISNGSFSFDVT